MLNFFFKNLLLSNYSFALRWVNKKMPERIIPSTLHFFISPFTFIIVGILFVVLALIEYRFKYPEVLAIVIILILNFGSQKSIEKVIIKWNIEKEYKALSKSQRRSKNTFAFLFFWGSFVLMMYLAFKYSSVYVLKSP